MSPSRDIKALFDRFGGDPDSYREIRMESEAHEARGRWPLLGMIDPRKVELSAADTARGVALAGPEAEQAAPRLYEGVQNSPAPVAADTTGSGPIACDRSQAALRRSAPLFTRSPRRDIPPVIEKPAPRAPESGAFRFSPQPAALELADEAAQADPAGAATGLPSPASRIAPRRAPPAPPAMNASPEPGVEAQPLASAAPSSSSPLKKLFGTAAPTAPGTASAQDVDAGGRLDRLFDRLRGGSGVGGAQGARMQGGGVEPKGAATPRHPGFLKGAGRP
ncbi:cellulose biosynthesis protein BcsP [Paraburkholderia acidipaludis]|uniref:cellulose biosynthesis protein BcsP n=1 Tax=Paraburkholderia acidipaludis TaxID=660537 RepID=UPI0012EB175B|nr:cellulose biosynthesis protein BcsP [Paraburkholderia acidipaludis]